MPCCIHVVYAWESFWFTSSLELDDQTGFDFDHFSGTTEKRGRKKGTKSGKVFSPNSKGRIVHAYLTREEQGLTVDDIAESFGVERHYPARLAAEAAGGEKMSRKPQKAKKPCRLGPEFREVLDTYLESVNYQATYRQVHKHKHSTAQMQFC